MARTYAKLHVGIWTDDGFKKLSSQAQRLYIYLFGHPRLDDAGTLPWQPNIAARTAPDITMADVETAMQELRQQRFIILDEETGVLAVRSYVRNDGILANSKNTTAFVKAWGVLDSDLLKSVISFEVDRIAAEQPKLSGLEQCKEILEYPLVDASNLPIQE